MLPALSNVIYLVACAQVSIEAWDPHKNEDSTADAFKVRPPRSTWTVLQTHGPNHLGLRRNVLPTPHYMRSPPHTRSR